MSPNKRNSTNTESTTISAKDEKSPVKPTKPVEAKQITGGKTKQADTMNKQPAQKPDSTKKNLVSVKKTKPTRTRAQSLPSKADISEKTQTASVPPVNSRRSYIRFKLPQRVSHAILMATFIILALTGLPQEFALTGWADAMIKFFGGIDTTRVIHHTAAVVLILLAIYHLVDVGYKIFVQRTSLSMLPSFKDVKDALQAFIYNLGFGKSRPQMGRYTFEEKAEYWALIWGIVIMAITGFMMWNPIMTTRLLPGEIIPAAKAAHGAEAILAVLAIIVWHMYGVHLRHFNKAMWTGKQTEEEMLHDHPLELADIKSGLTSRSLDPKILRKRKSIYIPIATVVAGLMLFGLYGFVTGENTAITTVLPIASPVPIYAPATPTPAPSQTAAASSEDYLTGPLTWNDSIGPLLQAKCSMCHGAYLATDGLSLATYDDAMVGAQDGPVIVPGNIAGSKLILVQSLKGHPGQLDPAQLNRVAQWIAAGAPEK